MQWDHRPRHNRFGGILLQEYDPQTASRWSARCTSIFSAPRSRLIEGPHLYKRDGWYYLLTAEGGTYRTGCGSKKKLIF